MGELVTLNNVHKSVTLPDDSDLHILNNVSMSIQEGDRVSIVGRSGGGKSTLLNLLGLLDTPSQGELTFLGKNQNRISATRRAHLRGANVGFIFQQFNLMPERSALENVVVPMYYAGGRDFWNRTARATALLERVGLGNRLESRPSRLSGGEQQRVAIARALVRRPRLILADEPTGALDVETGTSVMNLLDEIATETGAALVVITHDIAIAERSNTQYRLIKGVLSDARTTPEPHLGDEALLASALAGSASASESGPAAGQAPTSQEFTA